MQRLTLFVFVAFVVALAAAVGQYYVPRSYYIIDAEGHASPPVPLRRLRRSIGPYPYGFGYGGGANANADARANAQANSWGGGDATANANANANARASSGSGGWDLPAYTSYGSSNPAALSPGLTARQYGPVLGGRSVSASSSVGLDSAGQGFYDQYTSVSN